MLQYFGTSLTSAGHYFWILTDYMSSSDTRFGSLPFNPEKLPVRPDKYNYQNGRVDFHHFGEYSVLAIEGSCYDERGGSKSVFFTKKLITSIEMVALLKETPAAKKIIDRLPFEVKWASLLKPKES